MAANIFTPGAATSGCNHKISRPHNISLKVKFDTCKCNAGCRICTLRISGAIVLGPFDEKSAILVETVLLTYVVVGLNFTIGDLCVQFKINGKHFEYSSLLLFLQFLT